MLNELLNWLIVLFKFSQGIHSYMADLQESSVMLLNVLLHRNGFFLPVRWLLLLCLEAAIANAAVIPSKSLYPFSPRADTTL